MSTEIGRGDVSWLDDVSDQDVEQAIKEVVGRLRARGGTEASPEGDEGWSPFVDVLDLKASPETPPCVLAGFAWRGRLSIVSGPPKAGKSTAMAQAIGCRLSGETFGGQKAVSGGPVAIVTEEPLELLARRLNLHGVTAAHRGAVFVASPGHGVDRLLEALVRSRPEVVVVDSFTPWALAAGADSLSDAAGMRRVMDALRLVVDAGAGVVVVHHGRRSDGALADSRDLAASVDMVIAFDPVNDEGQRCQLGSSSLRRLSYLGRWPQDGVQLDFNVRQARYELDQRNGGTS